MGGGGEKGRREGDREGEREGGKEGRTEGDEGGRRQLPEAYDLCHAFCTLRE